MHRIWALSPGYGAINPQRRRKEEKRESNAYQHTKDKKRE